MSELKSQLKPEDKSKSKKKTSKKKVEIIPPLLVIANAQSRRGQKDPTNNPFPGTPIPFIKCSVKIY